MRNYSTRVKTIKDPTILAIFLKQARCQLYLPFPGHSITPKHFSTKLNRYSASAEFVVPSKVVAPNVFNLSILNFFPNFLNVYATFSSSISPLSLIASWLIEWAFASMVVRDISCPLPFLGMVWYQTNKVHHGANLEEAFAQYPNP